MFEIAINVYINKITLIDCNLLKSSKNKGSKKAIKILHKSLILLHENMNYFISLDLISLNSCKFSCEKTREKEETKREVNNMHVYSRRGYCLEVRSLCLAHSKSGKGFAEVAKQRGLE